MSLRTVADASLAPPQFGALQSPDSGQVWFRWSLLRVAIVTADVLAPFEMRVLDNGTIVLSDSSDESPSPPPSPPKPPPRLAARKTARKAVRPTAPARERNGAAAPATKQQQQQQLKQAVATRRKQPSPPASSAAESSEDEAPSRTLRRLKRREAASPPSSPDGMKTRKRASTGAALPVPKKKAAKVEEQSQRALGKHEVLSVSSSSPTPNASDDGSMSEEELTQRPPRRRRAVNGVGGGSRSLRSKGPVYVDEPSTTGRTRASARRAASEQVKMSFTELQAQQQMYEYLTSATHRRHVSGGRPEASVAPTTQRSRVRRARARSMDNSNTADDPVASEVATPLPKVAVSASTFPALNTAASKSESSPSCLPVVHNTSWRGLIFESSPINVLPKHRSIPLPFSTDLDRPLHEYDPTGNLLSQVAIQTKFVHNPKDATVTNKMLAALSEHLPKLRQLHATRSIAILKATRKSLRHYIPAARRARTALGSHFSIYHSSFEATPIERAISKRRLISMNGKTGLLNELVGKITYVIGEGIALADRSVTGNLRVEERLIYPETVITLKDMSTPLRTSTAFTTVKKNVQEEDAPILRHVPYLGENATLSIEPLRYDAISITKARIEFTTPEAKTLLKFVVPSALDDEVSEYLLRILVSEFGPSHHVFNLLKKFPVFEQPEADYRTLQDRHRHRQKLTQRIREMKDFVAKAKKSREVASSATAALVNLTTNNRFLRDMSTATASTLLDSFGSSFDSSYLQNPESHGLKEADSLDGMLESYRSLFCRRCFRYDCAEHGIECPLPQKRSDPVDPIARLMEPAADIDSTASPPDVGQYVADRSPDVDSTISSSDENQSSSDGENPLEQTQAEAGPSRRSRRAQTKNCTLASKSLQIQEAMQEKQRSDKLKADRERVARLIKSGRFADCVDNEVLKWVASKAATLESDRATCSQHCWKSTKQENDSKKMPKSTQLILERVVATITKNPCVIAAILTGAPCSQVNNWVKKIIESAKTSTTASDERERSSKRTKRQSKRSSKNGAVQDTPHPYRRAHSYEPCAHDGPCEDCQCVKRGLQCEAACSCSRDCSNRMGCKCGVGNCRTRTCPCFLANRECDPDKCFTCGAAVAALTSTSTSAASKSDAVHENLCANVNMQRGAHKKVAIAFSDVHGYGAFAMEPILKSEFVYEYTGGIISDDEAERRGGIYDRLNLTFLFDLNLDEVVDAMRKGNKSKFANHASGERANCEARIICVRGEHRIGLYAKRDITAGEELLYDYGWVHEDAPSWSQTRTTRAHSEDSWIDAIEIDDD